MDSLHNIFIFLKVTEAGSLSAAARAMGISTAAVSASLARLEGKLDMRLLNRTTRKLSLTSEGSEFYFRCKQIAADLEEAELMAGRASREPRGRLRVSMPSTIGRLWIVPHLSEFTQRYPAISLDVTFSDFVPFTIDNEVDVSVQVGELQGSRLAVRRLASTRYVICASPDYLAKRGTPESPEALSKHDCLAYRRPRNGRIREWRFTVDGVKRQVPVNGCMTFNSGDALVVAALAGQGIIQLAEYYVRPYLESGELVAVLGSFQTEGYDISVVFPRQGRVAPKLRVFVDYLLQLFDTPAWAGAKQAGD